MSRIIVIGDMHLYSRKGSKLFHDILLRELEWSFSQIKKNDIVVILGDIFDSRSSIDFKILNDAWNYFIRLSRSCKELYILVGNHDLYYKETSKENTNCRFLEFEPGSDSKIAPVRVIAELSEIRLNNKSCLFIPWIDTQERKDAAKKALEGKFDLIFGHFDIVGLYSKEPTESDFLAFELSDLPKDTPILSGHFHRRLKKKNLQYVGSFINNNFNDIDDVRGLHIIDEKNKITFVQNNCPMFHYMTIENPSVFINAFNQSDSKTKESINKQVSGNFIKIFLNEYSKENDEVYKIIKSMNPLDLSVEFNKVSFDNDKEVIDFEGFDSKTDISIALTQYIETIKNKIPKDISINNIKNLIQKKSLEFKQSASV